MAGNYTDLYPALYPLYDFSHWFLGTVLQPKTLDDIADEIDFSDPGQIIASFSSNWQLWVSYFLGFVILAAFGIAFIVIFSICGICMCSCRCCCGNCGAKGSKQKGSCKNVCCSIWLFCLVFIIMLGVIWSILANIALWEETKQGQGAIKDLQIYLLEVDKYTENTADEIDQNILWNFALAKNTVFSMLDNAGPALILNLGKATNAGPALDELVAWTDSLPGLQTSLQEAEALIAALQSNGTILASELATLQADIIADATLCKDFEPLCQDLITMAANIGMGVDYNYLQGTQISLALTSVTYAINDDIGGSIEDGVAAFLAIGEDVNTQLEPSVTQIKTSVNELEDELITYTELFVNATEQVTTANIISTLEDVEPDVEKYGNYVFWCWIALSSVLGLIVLFYYAGLCCGTCCKKSTCAQKTASKCMISANCCSFVFAWLLMVITTVGFLSGGPAYTELCRHLTSLETSEVISLIDDALVDTLGYNLSVTETIQECQNDSSAYEAFQLERFGINISAILDLDQYNVKDSLDAIKQIQIDVGTVTILTEQANETLLVALSGLNAINFTWHYVILEQEVVTQDLEELAMALDATASAIAVGTLKQQFELHANTSRELNSGLVQIIDTDRQALNATLQSIQQDINAYPIQELIVDISVAQDNLNAYGNEYLSGLINSSVDQLYVIMENSLAELETTITEDIGQCESLYLAVVGIIDVACVQVLDPFNSFWLAYGWSLWLLIPCVCIGYSLGDHYRRSVTSHDIDSESTDGSENPVPSTSSKTKKNQVAPDVVTVQPKNGSHESLTDVEI